MIPSQNKIAASIRPNSLPFCNGSGIIARKGGRDG